MAWIRRTKVLWKLPDTCMKCGAAVDHARAESQPDPRCRYCHESLPHDPFVPPLPAPMQALIDRVITMSDAIGIPSGVPTAESSSRSKTPRSGFDDAVDEPGAHGSRAVVTGDASGKDWMAALSDAPGAQWLAAPNGDWWRWSWFDHQWQQDLPRPGSPAGEDGCWVHWVESVDGRWTRAGSGPSDSLWPTPAPL